MVERNRPRLHVIVLGAALLHSAAAVAALPDDWRPELRPLPDGEARGPQDPFVIELPAAYDRSEGELALELDNVDVTARVRPVDETYTLFRFTPYTPLARGEHVLRMVEYAAGGEIIERGRWRVTVQVSESGYRYGVNGDASQRIDEKPGVDDVDRGTLSGSASASGYHDNGERRYEAEAGLIVNSAADDQGRDVFSTILFGLRISLFVGFSAVILAMVIGVTLGLIAGFVGGWPDTIIMRVADVQLTFPAILVAMLIFGIAKGIVPPEYRNQVAIWVLILAIGLSDWVQFARVVRGATMVEAGKEYVQAARLIGRSGPGIMVRHILPNALNPVLVIATISLALAIIAEATLSFLGVGAPPTKPSLGTLIRIGQEFMFSGEWWILFFPAVTLLALALSINLLGDWLRDALNPRLR